MNAETLEQTGRQHTSDVTLGRRTRVWVRVVGVVGFALATVAGANVAIPLPATPVPMTLQTLVVLMAGVTLGPRLGLVSMTLYLLLGTTGYHVFAGANWGLSTLFGATGGYLIGFVLAQPVLGWLTRPGRNSRIRLLAALLTGNVVVFASGLAWLTLWSGAGIQQAVAWGLWPFVPGMIAKTALALGIGDVVLARARRWFDDG